MKTFDDAMRTADRLSAQCGGDVRAFERVGVKVGRLIRLRQHTVGAVSDARIGFWLAVHSLLLRHHRKG